MPIPMNFVLTLIHPTLFEDVQQSGVNHIYEG